MTILQPRQPGPARPMRAVGTIRSAWMASVGAAAIAFSAVYLFSDVLEAIQGDFSTVRLCLTYIGEAAIPLFAIGLYAAQRPRVGRLGLFGAVAYAYSYVFFTTTVMYALVAHSADYDTLTKSFGIWMTIHGLIMLVGGLAFGLAVVRARVFPQWTGFTLMAGVVLVAAASDLPNIARAIAEAFPAAAFTGMGVAALGRSSASTGDCLESLSTVEVD